MFDSGSSKCKKHSYWLDLDIFSSLTFRNNYCDKTMIPNYMYASHTLTLMLCDYL